jgi:hypothetical protein
MAGKLDDFNVKMQQTKLRSAMTGHTAMLTSTVYTEIMYRSAVHTEGDIVSRSSGIDEEYAV